MRKPFLQKGVRYETEGNFLNSEADQWYLRNRDTANESNASLARDLISPYLKSDCNLLEVGCSAGYNRKLFGKEINYYGIDPSSEAIARAQQEASGIFKVGTADSLDFEGDFFDVVYFGFCLYLVDRQDLIKVVSETDRVLRPGGYLLITDFSVPNSYANEYVHYKGLKSFKTDCSKYFLTFPNYSMISYSLDLKSALSPGDIDGRVANWLIRKDF